MIRRYVIQRRALPFFLCAAVLIILPGNGTWGLKRAAPVNMIDAATADIVELTLSVAISLKDALGEIAHLYNAEHPGVTIHFNLGGPGTLQRQIEQGAPVDIFFSASPKKMDLVESQGLLLAGTRKNLVRKSVVLIVPSGNAQISVFPDLTKAGVKSIRKRSPRANMRRKCC